MRLRLGRRGWAIAGLALAVVGAGVGIGVTATSGSTAPRPAGVIVNRAIPARPLLDEQGRRTSLAAFRGKVVALSPFLTLCHEICPLTTGAFVEMQRALAASGLADKVVFLEISTDPWRDTPARLRAFRRMTGVRFQLLTGTEGQLTRFWHDLGVGFSKAPEDTPPDTDWLTGKPLTFDVTHTDGLFLVGPDGRWRIANIGVPSVAGHLSPVLSGLLNAAGKRALHHPEQPWTVAEGLADIGSLLGRRIPQAA